MTKTMRRILLIIAVLFCVSCLILVGMGVDVRICMPFVAAAMALMTTAVMQP